MPLRARVLVDRDRGKSPGCYKGYGGAVRVVCVAGARPNFMKVKPVLDALDERGAETVLVHTGQHYDPAMSEIFFEELGLRAA